MRARFERRQLVAAEAQLVGPAQHRIVEDLECDRCGRAQPAQELGDELLTLPAPGPGNVRDLRSARTGNHGVEAIDELPQGLVHVISANSPLPRSPFLLIGATMRSEWASPLDGRLAADAQLSLAERMFRIAFEA